MKNLIAICGLVIIAMLIGVAQSQLTQALLSNNRYMTRQLKCVLGQSSCDRYGLKIKESIPETVCNNCGRCTEDQKQTAEKIFNWVQKNYPNEWKQITQLCSPKQ